MDARSPVSDKSSNIRVNVRTDIYAFDLRVILQNSYLHERTRTLEEDSGTSEVKHPHKQSIWVLVFVWSFVCCFRMKKIHCVLSPVGQFSVYTYMPVCTY